MIKVLVFSQAKELRSIMRTSLEATGHPVTHYDFSMLRVNMWRMHPMCGNGIHFHSQNLCIVTPLPFQYYSHKFISIPSHAHSRQE